MTDEILGFPFEPELDEEARLAKEEAEETGTNPAEIDEETITDFRGIKHKIADLDAWELWEYAEAHLAELRTIFAALQVEEFQTITSNLSAGLDEWAEEMGFTGDDD
jgi:hypothetical protein